MNRRSFFTTLFAGAAAVAVAPLVPAVPKRIPFKPGGVIPGYRYTSKCRWPLSETPCGYTKTFTGTSQSIDQFKVSLISSSYGTHAAD